MKQMGRMDVVNRKLEKGEGEVKRLNKNGTGDVEWVVQVHDRMMDVCVDPSEEKDQEGMKRWHKLILDQYMKKDDWKNIPECDREEEMGEETEEERKQ